MHDAAELMETGARAQEAGDLDVAAGCYLQVLDATPDNPFALHNLAVVETARGRLDRACSLLESLLAQGQPADEVEAALADLGLALYAAGHIDAARSWLERVRGPGVTDPAVRSALARSRAPTHLASEVWDAQAASPLLRAAPREASTYIYAIDVVGTCNLRCPTCPVGNFTAAGRPRGFMDEQTFTRILDKVESEAPAASPEIWLFNWGEPLLHPALPVLIGAVLARGLSCHLSSNLNIKPQRLEAALRAEPTSLKISLSGFTDATYGATHARGRLSAVKDNMRLIRRVLDETGVGTRVWVGHHLYRSNVDQLDEVRAFCEALGFEHHPIAAFYQPLERLVALAEGREAPAPILDDLLDHPLDYMARFRDGRRRDLDCELRANQTTINHDGSVALCCSVYDPSNQLGVDFLDEPHEAIEARKYAHPFCATCTRHGLHYAPMRVD